MDYKKKYEESLENLKRIKTANKDNKELVDFIEYKYPELCESEDEKIRKELIEFVKSRGGFKQEYIAWLENEKQGKQLEYNWSKEDIMHFNRCLGYIDAYVEPRRDDVEWFKSLKDRIKGEQKKINLVEILKHYPKETELYSPLYGKLWLAKVDEEHEIITCYKHPLDEECTRAILEQEETVSFYSNGTTGLPDFNVSKDCMLFLYNIEEQGEQKPADKVEPIKIEKDKWYICIRDLYDNYYTRAFCKGRTYHAIKDETLMPDNSNIPCEIKYFVNDYFHLWTIQDAKDGDVLTTHLSPEGDWIGIYKQSTDNMFETYCFLNAVGEFVINPNRCKNHGTHGLHPATKEQCDLLFQKMKESGYEWSDKDRKLIKIAQ